MWNKVLFLKTIIFKSECDMYVHMSVNNKKNTIWWMTLYFARATGLLYVLIVFRLVDTAGFWSSCCMCVVRIHRCRHYKFFEVRFYLGSFSLACFTAVGIESVEASITIAFCILLHRRVVGCIENRSDDDVDDFAIFIKQFIIEYLFRTLTRNCWI